jgi:hypothetical protein
VKGLEVAHHFIYWFKQSACTPGMFDPGMRVQLDYLQVERTDVKIQFFIIQLPLIAVSHPEGV